MGDGCYTISLYYDPYTDEIYHEDGRVINDISHLISYEELEFLKRVGGTKYIPSNDEYDVMYEIVAPIPDDETMIFYYDDEHNVMLDEQGYIMFNIFAYVYPQDLIMFKKKKDDMRVYGKHGQTVDLIYSVF